MSVLLDTNILTRYSDPFHPQYKAAVDATALLRSRGELLYIVTQNVYEFWAVATRPSGDNGLGMSTRDASAASRSLRGLFTLLVDHAALFDAWERLVAEYDVKGKSAHDARLVAAMSVHGITQILTFNVRDFGRYQGITVLNPSDLVGPPSPPPAP